MFHLCESVYMCLCSMHGCVHVQSVCGEGHVCECLCTCGQVHVEPKDGVRYLHQSLLIQARSLGNLSAHQFLLVCLPNLPPGSLSLSMSTGIISNCHICLTFTWVLKILTHSSRLHTNCYPQSHSHGCFISYHIITLVCM